MKSIILPFIRITAPESVGKAADVGEIKSKINKETIEQGLKCGKYLKNEAFVRSIEESNYKFIPNPGYFSESVKEGFDIYGNMFAATVNGTRYVVQIYFYLIKNPELLTKQFIEEHKLIFQYHMFIKNNILNMDWHTFQLNQQIKALDEKKFYDLTYQQGDFCTTKLFPHQISNISKMMKIYYNENPMENMIPATDNLIIRFTDGLIFDFVANRFIEEHEIPRIKIRGGMILDEPGTGKTLQFLVFLIECNKKSIIVTPNPEIKKVWVGEFEKHFNVPLEDSKIKILCIQELYQEITINQQYLNQYEIIGIDEIHMFYSATSHPIIQNVFQFIIKSNIQSRWGITGTPFVNEQSLFHIIRFLSGRPFKNERFANILQIQKIIFKLFMRNIKANLVEEYEWPELNIHDILVELDIVQRNFYDMEKQTSNNKRRLRELVSAIHLMFEKNDIRSPEELKAFGIAHYKKIYETEQEKLVENQSQLMNILENEAQFESEQAFDERRVHYQKLIEEQSLVVKKHKSAYEYFGQSINAISDIFENKPVDGHCPICFDDYKPPITYLKKCGHYYCGECVSGLICANGIKCPICRQDSRKIDIITVSEVSEINNSPKMFEILRIIEQCDDERFIIFSQFNILDKLELFLGKKNISAVAYDAYARGQKDSQVLLMASHLNAEGINLSMFDNIIIFEPFEDQIYCREIEKQLIGRIHRIGRAKPVKVFRLITKDTIEEEIYTMV